MARSPGTGTGRGGPEERGGMRWLRKSISGAVGIVALAASGVLMVHAYSEGRSSASGGTPVLIKADPGPFKVKPDSPGGRAVPDRDKEIYDRIAAAPPGGSVERLLPPPEVPLPLPKVGSTVASEPPALPSEPTASEPEAKPVEKAAKTETEPARPPRQPAVEETYRLQLAALRSHAAVHEAWKRLQKRHRGLLARLRLTVEKKDLGPPKGVYYRLLAGPVSGMKEARRLCADLEKRNVGCLVVRR